MNAEPGLHYAKLHRLERARRALDLGYAPEKFQRNPQLGSLRADPRFPRSPPAGDEPDALR